MWRNKHCTVMQPGDAPKQNAKRRPFEVAVHRHDAGYAAIHSRCTQGALDVLLHNAFACGFEERGVRLGGASSRGDVAVCVWTYDSAACLWRRRVFFCLEGGQLHHQAKELPWHNLLRVGLALLDQNFLDSRQRDLRELLGHDLAVDALGADRALDSLCAEQRFETGSVLPQSSHDLQEARGGTKSVGAVALSRATQCNTATAPQPTQQN